MFNWGRKQQFDMLLDQYIDQLDYQSPSSVVRQQPAAAYELRPLLDVAAALRELGQVQLSPAAKQIGRARLRAAVLAERRRRYAVLPRMGRAMAWAAALLIVALSGVSGVTVASASALPNERLYGWKRLSEQAWLRVQPTPERAAEVALQIANRRADETCLLFERSGEVNPEVVADLGAAYQETLRYIAQVPGPVGQELLDKIHAQGAEHMRELGALAQQAHGTEQEVLQAATDMSAWVQTAAPNTPPPPLPEVIANPPDGSTRTPVPTLPGDTRSSPAAEPPSGSAVPSAAAPSSTSPTTAPSQGGPSSAPAAGPSTAPSVGVPTDQPPSQAPPAAGPPAPTQPLPAPTDERPVPTQAPPVPTDAPAVPTDIPPVAAPAPTDVPSAPTIVPPTDPAIPTVAPAPTDGPTPIGAPTEVSPTGVPVPTAQLEPTDKPAEVSDPTKEPKPTDDPKPTKEPNPADDPKPTKEPKPTEDSAASAPASPKEPKPTEDSAASAPASSSDTPGNVDPSPSVPVQHNSIP